MPPHRPAADPPPIAPRHGALAQRLIVRAVEHCGRWADVAEMWTSASETIARRELDAGMRDVGPTSSAAARRAVLAELEQRDWRTLETLERERERWSAVFAVCATALGGDELGDRERPELWMHLVRAQLTEWGSEVAESTQAGVADERRVFSGSEAWIRGIAAPGVERWWQALAVLEWVERNGPEGLGGLEWWPEVARLSGERPPVLFASEDRATRWLLARLRQNSAGWELDLGPEPTAAPAIRPLDPRDARP
jgi:hypothetical protein